jgi:hypothetical protein
MRVEKVLRIGAIVCFLALMPGIVTAQDEPKEKPKILFSLPIEFDYDHGAFNGKAFISRYLPLLAIPMGQRWSLINLTMAVVADAPGGIPGQPGNPEPIPGERVFGTGDLINATFLTPPPPSKEFVWGVGPLLGIPTASDPRLGSGKWSAGPSFRFAWRPGFWNIGAIIGNLWSYAGDAERGDFSQLMVRPLVRRRFGSGWYFAYNPTITANWDVSSGRRWLVPVGGGIGKVLTLGNTTMAVSVHYYYSAIRQDTAPKGLFRVALVLPIPGSQGE